jgi:membrane protease YdiL (CAAX protease family)
MLRRHPWVSTAVGAVTLAILLNGARQRDLFRAVLYLAAVAISCVAAELVFRKRHCADAPVPVHGASVEAVVLVASFALGLFWLYTRFVRQSFPPPGVGRLLWLAVLIGCVFSALPAIVLLLRYRLQDLGVRVTGVAAVPIVIVIFAAATALSPVPTVTWPRLLKESGGSLWSLTGTLLTAAVPEEFFRFAWQTRVGALRRNRAAGWFIASVAWAILHAPRFWDEGHSAIGTLMGVVDIVPLGLLWGYLMHRTRSLLPSTLLHATNIWGLQNLA